MVTLVPIDHDPFAAAPASQGGPRLVPVDFDPFAERRTVAMPSYDAAGNPTGVQEDVAVDTAQPSVMRDRIDDVVKSAGGGLVRGVAGLAGLPAAGADVLMAASDAVAQKLTRESDVDFAKRIAERRANVMFPGAAEAISPAGIQRGIETVTGPAYKPQTTAGEYASTLGEFVPGGMIGRIPNLARNLVTNAVAPAIVSETAGQATKGSQMEGPARLAGALAGGVGASLAQRAGSAERILQRATEGVTPAELDAAERLMQEAQRIGAPLTRAEAVQAVTGGRSGLGDLQHTVENMGSNRLREFNTARPDQTDAAARQAFDDISPAAVDPAQVGPAVGRTSEDIVREAERLRTNATSPYYQRAATDHVPTPEMQQFIANLDNSIAADSTGIIGNRLREIRGLLVERPATPGTPAVPAQRVARDTPNGRIYETTPGTPARPGTPEQYITDIENLDRVRKYVRDRVDMPQIGADAITKEQGAAITRQIDDLRQRMIAASPDFAAGKQLHQDITRQFIEPLMNGPIGKLAQRDTTTKKAIDTLFPQNPLPKSAGAIGETMQALSARSPRTARELVRTYTEATFNEVSQRLASGPNQAGGARFAAVLRGNPEQAANLEAAIRALPNGEQVWPGFNRFLDVMEAQQYRQATGSRTAFKGPAVNELKNGGIVNNIGQAIGSGGFKIPGKVQDAIQQWNVGRNLDQLSWLLTDPTAANRFRNLATANERNAPLLVVNLANMAMNAPERRQTGDRWSVTARPAQSAR